MKKIIFILIALLLAGCDKLPDFYSQGNSASRMDRAMYMGDLAAVKNLVEKEGFDVNTVITNQYKERPIHIAAYYGRTSIVAYLASKGAKLDEFSGDKTALLIAISKRNESTALALLRLGANPNINTTAGLSPCELAFRTKLYKVAAAIPKCDINVFKNRPPCPDVPTPCARASNPASAAAESRAMKP
jgi:hypothetical protein